MKVFVILLTLALVGGISSGQARAADDNGQDKASDAHTKEFRWQGHISRINKGQSYLIVLGANEQTNGFHVEKQIFFDSSTQWSKLGKPVDQSEFKEGSFVIVLGYLDGKSIFHAVLIDLRRPR